MSREVVELTTFISSINIFLGIKNQKIVNE